MSFAIASYCFHFQQQDDGPPGSSSTSTPSDTRLSIPDDSSFNILVSHLCFCVLSHGKLSFSFPATRRGTSRRCPNTDDLSGAICFTICCGTIFRCKSSCFSASSQTYAGPHVTSFTSRPARPRHHRQYSRSRSPSTSRSRSRRRRRRTRRSRTSTPRTRRRSTRSCSPSPRSRASLVTRTTATQMSPYFSVS